MSWQKLKNEFIEKGITRCELCGSDQWLTPMHRLKRREYTKKTLWTFPEVIIACIRCHSKLEYNREETNKVFAKLRIRGQAK